MAIRVFIVDDHREMRVLYKVNIAGMGDAIVVCGEAETGEEALEKLPEAGADVVITDVSLPGMNGVELVSEIRKAFPGMKILVASIHQTDYFGESALRAGADAVMSKMELEKIPDIVTRLAASGCTPAVPGQASTP
jgi:DNA-binding NarL/FixJ family response regulator